MEGLVSVECVSMLEHEGCETFLPVKDNIPMCSEIRVCDGVFAQYTTLSSIDTEIDKLHGISENWE